MKSREKTYFEHAYEIDAKIDSIMSVLRNTKDDDEIISLQEEVSELKGEKNYLYNECHRL